MNDQFTIPEEPETVEWWANPDRGCAGTPDEMWFFHDTGHKGDLPVLVAAARARCEVCPVLPECGEDALENDDRHGVRAAVLLSAGGAGDRVARIRASIRVWRKRHADRVLAVSA